MPVAAPTTGLVGRFKASTITGVSNGASITSWADTVGTRVLSPRNGNPTLATGQLNGKTAVRFNGSSDLQMTNPPTVAQPFSIIAVLKSNVVDTQNHQVIWQGAGGEVYTENGFWTNYSSTVRSSNLSLTTDPAVITSNFNGDNSDSRIYKNGVLSTGSTNVGTSSLDQGVLVIGGHGTASARWWNGDIYEILIYNKTLNASERAQAHSYVQDEYAISVSDYTSSGTPSSRIISRWNGSTLVNQTLSSWNGSALVTKVISI